MPERKARRREINAGIRQVYDAVVNEPLPPSFQEWLAGGPLAHESSPARNEPQP